MSPISRGFRGRSRVPAGEEDRVPPGQHVTTDFPVLSAGPTPQTPLPEWTFSITQGGDTLKSWTWQEMRALPAETITADIHCVTRWSKFGTVWEGVSVDTLLDAGGGRGPLHHGVLRRRLHHQPADRGRHRRQSLDGLRLRGEPLDPEHGGPARLLVPHLYFWKSAKWVRGLRTARSRRSPASGRHYGYHMYGDPWREQRYAGD